MSTLSGRLYDLGVVYCRVSGVNLLGPMTLICTQMMEHQLLQVVWLRLLPKLCTIGGTTILMMGIILIGV